MQKDKNQEQKKYITSYDHIISNDKFVPSYNGLKSISIPPGYSEIKEDKNFETSYKNLKVNKKFKPAYGRPRRSILTLPFRYYKWSLAVITIIVIIYLTATFL